MLRKGGNGSKRISSLKRVIFIGLKLCCVMISTCGLHFVD
jgi:hypothetical protein